MKRLVLVGCVILTATVLISTSFVLFFNRAPERTIPGGNVVVSPAHGTIIHIETVPTKTVQFFKNDVENILDVEEIDPPYTIVVIEMTPMNVHVQRTPIGGTVTYQEHIPGKHKNALSGDNIEKLANVNEKNVLVVKNDDLSVGVIQVAGRAARRIRSSVSVGDVLEQGDIYGRILLGSQVVVILPESVTVTAQMGDAVIDGETILGTY